MDAVRPDEAVTETSAALSIVIPVLNEGSHIAGLLERLTRQLPTAQRIVVDGGSTDGTAVLAESLADIVLQSAPGRARQMNAGAAAASGDQLLFLHADTVLPDNASDHVNQTLRQQPGWGFFPVAFDDRAFAFRVIAAFMNGRSRLTAVATGDQGLFVTRELFEAVGGFDEVPLMEDVLLSKKLRRQSRPRVASNPVTTSARRWRKYGVVRTVLLMWALRFGLFVGVSPQRLAGWYD